MSKHHKTHETPAEATSAPAPAPATPAPQQEAPASKSREQELLEQLQRLQAEFDNYRKRIDAEAALAQERGQEKAIKEILPIVDAIELALKHAAGPEGHKELLTGVTLIQNQLRSLLEQWSVNEIPLTGPVDPRMHEVYMTEARTDVPTNSVAETLQKGYTRNGTILRTAKVKAARAN